MNAVDDWPTCNHERTGLVADVDPALWASRSPRRSASVCESPRCQSDAIAWVELGTSNTAAYYSDAERGIK